MGGVNVYVRIEHFILNSIDYQSGIQHGLDIVELRTIVATATYLKGRALMCFMECRAAEALECFER